MPDVIDVAEHAACVDCGARNSSCLPGLPGGGVLCEACEDGYVFCAACDGYVREDDCRHVIWADADDCAAGWHGCGSDQQVWLDTLAPILRALGRRRVKRLLGTLRAGTFHTWSLGSMFGPETLYFEPARQLQGLGERLTRRAMRRERWRLDAQYGIAWLQSLQPRVTVDAYRDTAALVTAWLDGARVDA